MYRKIDREYYHILLKEYNCDMLLDKFVPLSYLPKAFFFYLFVFSLYFFAFALALKGIWLIASIILLIISFIKYIKHRDIFEKDNDLYNLLRHEARSLQVCGVHAIDSSKLWLRFNTGEIRFLDFDRLSRFLSPSQFQQLQDYNFFQQVYVDFGNVAWSDEIQIEPKFLYYSAKICENMSPEQEYDQQLLDFYDSLGSEDNIYINLDKNF